MPLDKPNMNFFPGPNMTKCEIEDSMMIRVDVTQGEIGSRNSGLPKALLTEKMEIEHVGGSLSKRG